MKAPSPVRRQEFFCRGYPPKKVPPLLLQPPTLFFTLIRPGSPPPGQLPPRSGNSSRGFPPSATHFLRAHIGNASKSGLRVPLAVCPPVPGHEEPTLAQAPHCGPCILAAINPDYSPRKYERIATSKSKDANRTQKTILDQAHFAESSEPTIAPSCLRALWLN